MTENWEPKLPPIVIQKYDELYDLVQNQSSDGRLYAAQVAEYCHVTPQWLLNATYKGAVPFAFGTDKGVGRGTTCFHTLPFFSFMTQGVLFRPVADREDLQKLIRF